MNPAPIVARRIRELRQGAVRLSKSSPEVLNRIGAKTDRAAVAKTELGQRTLSLEESFRYAVALDVAPVHLFVPTDSDEPIQLARIWNARRVRCGRGFVGRGRLWPRTRGPIS